MDFRKAQLSDLNELQQLFTGTIKEVCKADYNSEQIRVWTSSIENTKRWTDILKTQYVLLAMDKAKITGFCILDKGNYVDFLYVHKDYQRQGIALKLYKQIEEEALKQGATELSSDVSKTARPFFERVGFKAVKEQTVERHGVKLTNYKMVKSLVHSAS